MKLKLKTRFTISLLITICLLIVLGYVWKTQFAPTKIALVSFPEYRLGQIQKANNNKWIKLFPVEVENMKHLNSYDFILVYPYGLTLTSDQIKQLQDAGNSGVSVFRVNRPAGINNLPPKHEDNVSAYLKNQCFQNYQRFLNYVRVEIDDKHWKMEEVQPAMEMSVNSFFYKDEDAIFPDLDSFKVYCKVNKIHHNGNKTIIIFAGMPGPFDTGRDQYTKLITALEEKDYNVFPVSGYENRKKYMEEIKPNAIVYFPVGRFSAGENIDATDFLKECNVPLFCPIGLYYLHDEWLKSKAHRHIVMSGQRIVTPEMDGGIVSYAVSAQYIDKDGYVVFDGIPERIEKFSKLVDNYVSLQEKTNKDKRVAIVYYKGPGKNAMGGNGLEGIPSLYNTLLKLKQEGFNLEGLPSTYEDFRDMLNTRGKTFGAYAKGAVAEHIEKGYPELIPVKKYEKWGHEILEDEMWESVNDKYGPPEDAFMATHTDSVDYIAVSRIQFGNITILPLPMSGYGDNTFKIIHGTEMPPPHDYLAPYFWIQKGFKADAIVHFGTHGSLEFLLGKKVAMSPYDWPDPIIGTTPHFYFYNISVVGEGIIAKRRSYATLLSHLTPPFMESDALKNSQLNAKFSKYESTEGVLKEEYALSVKKLIVAEGINTDLKLDDDLSKTYTGEEMHFIENYLEEIAREKVNGEQYVLGRPYTFPELDETARLMKINPLSYNLARIDELKGKISEDELDDLAYFSKHYTDRCNVALSKILHGSSAQQQFEKLVGKTDFERAKKWRNRAEQKLSHGEVLQMMVKLTGETKTSSKHRVKTSAKKADLDELKKSVVKVAANPQQKEFFLKLKSNEEFIKVSRLLDPAEKATMKKMAQLVPSIKHTIKISEDLNVYKLLRLIQNEENKKLVFQLLEDKELEGEVRRQEEKNDSLLLQNATSEMLAHLISLTPEKIESVSYEALLQYEEFANFYNENKEKLLALSERFKQQRLHTFLTEKLKTISSKINFQKEQTEQTETAFADAVFLVRENLSSVTETREQLANCPNNELDALINSLNGGYTAPSPGGDPVASPDAVPTGRNMFSVNVLATPTHEAWEVGKRLGKNMLDDYLEKHNQYPRKVNFTLWAGSFIESEGTTIAEIFYMLGAEPVWGRTGSVTDVRLISADKLGRPRIDVVVQTSGQFRDLGDSRLFLIQKAIEMAALDKSDETNYVSEGTWDAEQRLIEKGMSPKDARDLSTSRIFGGVNNSYGTKIMDMVESGGSWDSPSEVAQTFMHNLGAIYGKEETWAAFHEGVFEAALLNTDAIVQPRQSNSWGPISLDHVYEYMGGANIAIKEVTGKNAESYFNDYRNSSYAKIQNLHQAVWSEARSTMLNPKYLKEKMKGEASSAEDLAEVFRNTYGLNVMNSEAIDNQLWDKYFDMFITDKQGLGIQKFFDSKNPYAFQEMTAVMLETVRKGMWKASPEQIKTLADLHVKLVNDNDAGCSGFVCNNQKLQQFIEKNISDETQKENYNKQLKNIREARSNSNQKEVVLRKDQDQQNSKTALFRPNNLIIIGAFIAVLLLLAVFIKRRKK